MARRQFQNKNRPQPLHAGKSWLKIFSFGWGWCCVFQRWWLIPIEKKVSWHSRCDYDRLNTSDMYVWILPHPCIRAYGCSHFKFWVTGQLTHTKCANSETIACKKQSARGHLRFVGNYTFNCWSALLFGQHMVFNEMTSVNSSINVFSLI